MIQFKPYPSIGNAADAAWMAQVREQVEIGTLFAVQEKVDGANVSFLCDDLEVRMARRTAILDPLEPFFGYQQVLERYSGHIYHIYNRLRLSYPEMTSIAVYGELFGGYYPHPDVAPDPVGWPVQKGIWYTPGHDFYAFDLYVFTKDGGFFLPVMEANALFSMPASSTPGTASSVFWTTAWITRTSSRRPSRVNWDCRPLTTIFAKASSSNRLCPFSSLTAPASPSR